MVVRSFFYSAARHYNMLQHGTLMLMEIVVSHEITMRGTVLMTSDVEAWLRSSSTDNKEDF